MNSDKQTVYIELGNLMREMVRVFKNRIAEQTTEPVMISHEQFILLNAISNKKDDVIQKDMAEFLGKDKSSILRLIDSLEEKDLIRRVVDKNDRRKNYLMVTKIGERVIKSYQKIGSDMISEIQKGLTETQLQNFLETVLHIKENATKLK